MQLKIPAAGFSLDATATAPEEFCETEYCSPDGRFYPFVCGGDGQWAGTSDSVEELGVQSDLTQAHALGCRAFLAMAPTWDEKCVCPCPASTPVVPGTFSDMRLVAGCYRMFEEIIDKYDLPLVIQYVGASADHLNASIIAALDRGAEAVVYYAWQPSFLSAESNAQAIVTPDDNPIRLTKIVNSALRVQNPAAYSLIQSFSMTDAHMVQLLNLHPDTPSDSGAATVEVAACQWLQSNKAVWQPWVDTAFTAGLTKSNVTVGALFAIDDAIDDDGNIDMDADFWEMIEFRAAQKAVDHINAVSFVFKNDESLFKMMNFVLKMMNFALKMMKDPSILPAYYL